MFTMIAIGAGGLLFGFMLGAFVMQGKCPKCLARISDADAQLERLRSESEWMDKGVDA